MADVNANIGINLETSAALAQLKDLQRQLAIFNTSISKTSASAVAGQKKLAANLVNSINDTGKFVAEIRSIDTTVESFTKNLEKNKFSVKEYFRFAGASTKTFGRNFKGEFDTINKVAEDRVKRLSTQYIKLGRDATGTMQAISVMPKSLDMSSYSTQMQVSAQRQALFNQLVKQGSTGLINFGKNTQWAGRQLMVGFTIPLMILGSTASKTFLQMEEAAINFRKVYGDLFTPTAERDQALQDITALGEMFTKYGIAVSETVALAADAAAAGFAGLDLQRQTTEATRLSVLGQIDTQKALTTTIALQNAFKISSEEMADSINFLNAVENQTVLSLEDVTQAIPRVGPIIEQLGGNVKDLAFFLTAMKEGGVSAAQGANALKSGLASLIAPSDKAAAALMSYGININKIVEGNQGNLRQTVIDFAASLDTLDPLNRSRAIEQLFGKFQFARLSALFNNITTDGTQASRVLDLAGASIEELAGIAESELAVVSDATGTKFKKAMEDLKLALIPVGEEFLKAATPIVEFVSGILERFNNLSDGSKKAFTLIIAAVGGLAPIVLMSFGLLNNLIGNAIKFALTLRQGYLKLTGQTNILSQQTNYLTLEQTEAIAAAHSLNQSHAGLTQVFNVEREALIKLIAAYQQATKAAFNFAQTNRGVMAPGFNPNTLRGYNKGVVVVPGSGNKDTEPAMLTPGEAVIPAAMAKKYAPLISGMIAGNIPGYRLGKTGAGKFGMSVSDAKDAASLYKAPPTIKPQTVENTWSTAEAEAEAMIQAAEEYLKETVFSTKKIKNVLLNLVQKQASHITEQIDQIEVAGETIDVKRWNAGNLITDFGGINNYLNSIHKVTETLDEGEISKLASSLNISIEEFKSELKMLEEGIHPTTRKAGQVLGAVAKRGTNSTDKTLAYQSRAVSAGMDVRLQGDFYETVQDRAYDPTKDLKSLEQVEANVIKFKTKILDSFNISDDIAGLSGKNVQALQSAWSQLSIEAKERLIALSGDVNAFTAALMQEAKEAGIAGFEIGDETVRGIARGTGTQSPSRRTIPIGLDTAKGLEIGMQQGQPGVARAANQLRDTAVTSSGLVVPASAVGGGGGGINRPPTTFNQNPSDDFNESVIKNTKTVTSNTDKLQNMNRLMMSGSFALTSLAGAGQFAGGAIGEWSNRIFKLSGLLFGLQAVIQMVTGEMLLQKIAIRANNVATAMGTTSFKALFSKGGGLVGFGKNLLTAGKFLFRFIGPLGALTAAVAGAYFWWQKEKKKKQEELEAIEGLGNAAKLTANQVKTLGDFFGIVPQKLPSELASSAGLFVTGAKERTELETLKDSEKFNEEFESSIKNLRKATTSQAKLVLETISLELNARGFAQEQIDLIVKALQEESGQTDFILEFKDFNIDNYMKNFDKVAKRFKDQVEKQAQNFQTITATRFDPNAFGTGKGGTKATQFTEFAPETDEYKKQAKIFSTVFANAFDAISGRFKNGITDSEQYRKEIGKLEGVFNSLDAAAKEVALSKMYENIGKENADAIRDVTKLTDKLLLLKAALLGLDVSGFAKGLQDPINQATTTALDNLSKVGVRKNLTKDFNDLLKAQQEANKLEQEGSGGKGNANKELSDFDKKIQDVLLSLKNVKDAGINAAGGIKELIKALAKSGTGLNKFNGIAQQMLNMGKVGLNREFIDYVTSLDQKSQKAFISINNGVVKLTKDGKLLNKALKQISIGDLSKSFKTQVKDTSAQIIAFNKLRASGFSVAEALEAVSNAQFALAIATSKNSDKTKELIAQYQEFLRIQKEFESLDPEAVFNKALDEATQLLDAQEEKIRLDFEPRIEEKQDIVDQAQDLVESIQEEINAIQLTIDDDRRYIEENFDRPIEALQREANILSNELSLLDSAASDINERYDKQAEALTKISEINQDIIAQEKSRISLADALTKGDISAAAQAMQELRQTQATARQNSATQALQLSRENAVNNLRSSRGMTREQIEDRQFEIGQKTFRLEQDKLVLLDKIRVKEDDIYVIQTTRLRAAETGLKNAQKAAKDLEKQYEEELKPIKDQRLELEKVKNRIELAKFEGVKFEDQMKKVKDAVTKIKDEWDAIKSKEVTLTCKKEGCDCGEHSGSDGKEDPKTPKKKPPVDVKEKLEEDKNTESKDTGKKELNTEPLFTDAKDRNPEAFMGTKPSTISWWDQEQAMIKRAQEAKAAADGAVARAKNAVQIANVVKQEAAAASRGGLQPVSNAAKAAAAAAAEAEKKKNAKIANDLIKAQQYRNFTAAQKKNMGGIVKYASGGYVTGPGTGTSDSIPARLSAGEYVIKASSVKKYGKDTLDAMNFGSNNVPGYPMGGLIPYKDGGFLNKMKRSFKLSPQLAGSAFAWTGMENLERLLNLKYGANENSSGLSKMLSSLGRVAFNTAQGGVSGSPFGPLGMIGGSVAGLVEGLVGLAKDGSQYGVKGGSQSNAKRFNAKKELEKINLKNMVKEGTVNAGINVALTPVISKLLSKFAKIPLVNNALNKFSSKPKQKLRPVTSSSKASKTIERNIYEEMRKLAEQRGEIIPDIGLGEESWLNWDRSKSQYLQHFKDEKSDLGAALRTYWSKAYDVLVAESNPNVKGMSKEQFFNNIDFGPGNEADVKNISSTVTEFMKSANQAYVRAHGLNPDQPIALYKAGRGPDSPNSLGGYWSLSSKFADAYLKGGNLSLDSLYKAELLPSDFTTAIGQAGFYDEWANVISRDFFEGVDPKTLLVGKKKSNKKQGSTPKPSRAGFLLRDFYSSNVSAAPEGYEGLQPLLDISIDPRLNNLGKIKESLRVFEETAEVPAILPRRTNASNLDFSNQYLDSLSMFAVKDGGYIKKYGMGGPTDDSILARISNGEYIMSAKAVKKTGKGFMDKLNAGSLNLPGYAMGAAVRVPPAEPPPAQMMNKGGKVNYMPMGGLVPYMNMGGIFKPKGTDTVPAMLTPGEFVIRKYAVKDFGLDKLKAINEGTYSDGSVYNYNLNLNVKSESNPDQIAETVIAQIKRIDGQRIRGNRQ